MEFPHFAGLPSPIYYNDIVIQNEVRNHILTNAASSRIMS